MFDLLNQIISGVIVFLICTWLQKRFTILKTETSIKRVIVIKTIRNEYVEQEKPLSLSEKIYLSNSFFIILTYCMFYGFIYFTLSILTNLLAHHECFLLSQAKYIGFLMPNFVVCEKPALQTSLLFITAVGYLVIFLLSKFISDPVLNILISKINPDPFRIRLIQSVIFIVMMLSVAGTLHWLYSPDSLYTSLIYVIGIFAVIAGLAANSHEKA